MAQSASNQKPLSLQASVYADANEKLGKAHWDYNNLVIQWGNASDFEIIRRVGKGKYSEAFQAIDLKHKETCVIKVLKPVKKMKIKREIKVLQILHGGPNIVRLLDVCRDPQSKTPSIIFEYVDNTDLRTLNPVLTDHDVRFYMFQLLKALDYAHSKGIMHRDVKPGNILIDHKKKRLRLIDWGLAEFYHPNTDYNVRVATRNWKSPELLVGYELYDYSLDLWSLGCTLAAIIFRKDPFFQGRDNYDQLFKITKVLGTDELYRYLEKYDIGLDAEFDNILVRYDKKPWTRFVTTENQRFISNDAIDLVDKLLKYDHQLRLTAKKAMEHAYFGALNTSRPLSRSVDSDI
ncbi:kinase-like protein [Atractiella rhizophila]|nr:kinase-like protein [Atractiella rhizophila]